MSGGSLLRVLWQSAGFGINLFRLGRPALGSRLLRASPGHPLPFWAAHSTPRQCYNVKNTAQPIEEEVGPFTKLIEALGFTGPLKYSKWKIKIAGLRMYTCCVEKIDYEELFERCSLSDTLSSWFLVTQLHVWMALVRMKQEGREGKYMCRYIVHSMWEDLQQRGKIMGIESVVLKQHIRAMTENFYAAIFGYDEIQYLDSMNGEDLLLTGEVKWRPLLEDNPQSILKPDPPAYNDEGL
ncbi:ubiquinol-cytochrome-c reductase complex assembly factor 1 isoform X4 [Hypanus sabinus]|uniref:ubiquinol-cytochrome-c reductase complex assembly factor 1 isoform X4 n=1 Tax=Hypanus sabinus TaxID=79690 RepID=UPI0028C4E41A|nr:ubiquinol-cytochrome-c reductase complex assembly factor 1 isoform X4 [Hypanus sabinus]